MSFWNSGLIKKLEGGELPEIKTSFEWDYANFIDCMIGIFVLVTVLFVIQFLLRKLS